jgi:hypothetical protein
MLATGSSRAVMTISVLIVASAMGFRHRGEGRGREPEVKHTGGLRSATMLEEAEDRPLSAPLPPDSIVVS